MSGAAKRISETSERQKSPDKAQGLRGLLVRSDLIGVLIPLLLAIAGMTLGTPGFASAFNLNALLATVAVTSLVGLAQMSALAIGQFNLALPATGAFVGMALGWLLQVGGLPWPAAIATALLFASLLGLVQGLAIVLLRLNPFIVTLGLASAYYGLMYVALGNQRFQKIGVVLPNFGRGAIGIVPNISFVSFAVILIVWIGVNATVFGRRLTAVGANPVAARFSALPVGRTVVEAHVGSSALAGLAAILLVSRLAVGSPAIGQDWLLTSFAAPVLGGTLLSGGKIAVGGTVLGATLLAVIANGLVIIGVNQYWYQAGLGFIILGAVALDRTRLRILTEGLK
jgi:ribose transport system permease protein